MTIPKSIFLLLFTVQLFNLGFSQTQSSPKLVVLEIFKAAQTGDFTKLSGLCDPQGQSDGDAKLICNMINETEADQKLFSTDFAKGRIVGKTVYKENFASVKIKFGNNGQEEETIVLVKRGELWYIFGL